MKRIAEIEISAVFPPIKSYVESFAQREKEKVKFDKLLAELAAKGEVTSESIEV